ncbi:MAG: thiamine pyrophosphate-requiring protein [Chloroflexi bacterium]|nr:thiamine pyrophosphate-requiring protein [Chloroflexota bacterium]
MTSQGSGNQGRTVPVDYGAEGFVEMLNSNGVEYVFINSGTDTFPIQEAVTKFGELGRKTPKLVLCPDEATGIAAAHGHFMSSRKPQAVLVHVDAGTLQLGGGLHNAQRGRAGMVLFAGRAPYTFDGEMAGGKSLNIHWIQEQLDQAGAVRNFTKWDYELRRTENLQYVMQRAFQVAGSEPAGAVYMTLPREILMEPMSEMSVPPVERHGPATTPQADHHAIESAAEVLARAQSPLIITGQSGRNHSTVAAIVELAEAIGAPVVSEPVYMNFPTDHPMFAGGGVQPYLKDADVILAIDQDVPYIPNHGKPRPDATIIHIDMDPIKESIPLWVFPTDYLIQADSSKAIPALVDAVNGRLTQADRARVDERFQIMKDRHDGRRREATDVALAHGKQSVITPQWLSYCINQAIDQDTIVLDECVTNSGSVSSYIERTRPGTFFKSGGSSLGWALGASLGAKLANPDKDVVNVVGDGAFIYGCPTSSLWTAAVYDAPFLSIIYNNQIHNAPKRALLDGISDSYSERTDKWVGMELSPSVEFAMLAQSCHAYGEKVEDPGDVPGALDRALNRLRDGQPAVLDVRIERP